MFRGVGGGGEESRKGMESERAVWCGEGRRMVRREDEGVVSSAGGECPVEERAG